MKLNHDPAIQFVALIGILILADRIFHLKIPLFPLLLALAVAWAALHPGRRARAGFRGIAEDHQSGSVRTCNYVFSSAILDLTDSGALPEKAVLNAAFSSLTIRLPVDAAIVIHTCSALSSVSIPGRQRIVLGESTVQCGSRDPNAPQLLINASCAFGSIAFELG